MDLLLADCPVDCADRCTHRSFNFGSQQYFQILRVFYIRHLVPSQSKYCMLNYITFTPVQLLPGPPTNVEYERMKQSISRVMAWLKAAGKLSYHYLYVLVVNTTSNTVITLIILTF